MADFEAFHYPFERNISILGSSKSTFENYSCHVGAIALHYGLIPTLLDQELRKQKLLFKTSEALKTKKQAKTCSSKCLQGERQTIKYTNEADR